jgi:hypothetical protein
MIFIDVRSMNYLVELLHILYMGVQVEICVHEFAWSVNNNIKPTIFCDVLYDLNVIFFQRVFEALKNVFRYSNKISRRDISNGVNISSNKDFMRKLQHKQWRVNFKTQLTLCKRRV